MKNNKQDSTFWEFVDKFKTVAELIATLIVVIPALVAIWGLIQQGLTAVIPAWVVLVTAILGILSGYLIGRAPILSQFRRPGALIEKIDFGYKDSPLEHGWRLGGADETQVTLRHISDGFVGNALEIRSTARYRLDYSLSAAARLGTFIEFVAKFEGEAYVCTLTKVQSKDSNKTRNLWLSFTVGNRKPKRIDDGSGSWYEYRIWVKPIRLEGNWLLFRIDLKDAVMRSAGREGWRFSELLALRLRGNQSLAYISIHE